MLRSPLSGFIDSLACTLLPASCTLCGTPQPRLSSVPICSACWQEILPSRNPHCTRCSDAIDLSAFPLTAPAGAVCRTCRLAPPPFERAVAFGPYTGRMRSAIFAFKYQGLRPAARRLGDRLAEAIATLAPEAPPELLVIPVPLHRSKFRRRGFNQSALLAEHALHRLRHTHPRWRLTLAPGLLQRHRATVSQTGLTRHQRRANVRNAFAVPSPQAVKDRDLLVIDDIITTGATARSAARALLNAGARTVYFAALARAGRNASSFDSGIELRNLHLAPPDASFEKPALIPIRLYKRPLTELD
ncbi:MAG TPA: phosphoribosyltransferase family protein [Terracidiphilus sp.]|nr:phosphoribosyltransferase family protein [Terracidiphilus sp.]